jgi:short-subunit dehydrogenase
VGLTGTLRVEGRAHGVRATALCPGFLRTNIYDAGEYVRYDREESKRNLPFGIVPLESYIPKAVRGIERDHYIITAPLYARVLWWLVSLSPGLLQSVMANRLAGMQVNKKS